MRNSNKQISSDGIRIFYARESQSKKNKLESLTHEIVLAFKKDRFCNNAYLSYY